MTNTDTVYLQFLLTLVGGAILWAEASADAGTAAAFSLVLLAAAFASFLYWIYLHASARIEARRSEDGEAA